ncbi:trimeric intracellular cation channel family protein [Colwellia echini]|uniref:Trimeric intracellular cation channel family protein n=1 Tax=Colwellia echini TaxID=1982103 RepID=A0ABY3N0I0_9GAMM|nr:trimeric intracellular cation channel family protein [Colwellia echini]TYK66994.1 trimeric intracellular cation channel family protein [Colwellia echini]
MYELLFYLDIFGVIVFALSGALMAGRYQLDPFGVVVLASVTAVGGGTIRDVILQTPVFWVVKPYYLYVILATALLTIIIISKPKRIPKRFLLIADALGLALFAVVGTQKALHLGAPIPVAVVLGTITSIAGGMIRDVLCNVIPMILREEIYALAAILGGSLYVLLHWLGWSEISAMMVAVTAALTLRLAAIYWHLSLPAFHLIDLPSHDSNTDDANKQNSNNEESK